MKTKQTREQELDSFIHITNNNSDKIKVKCRKRKNREIYDIDVRLK
jgi:hypothetical protein